MTDSEVKMTLSSYLTMHSASEKINKTPFVPEYVLPRIKINGDTKDDCCVLNFEFEINVTSTKWQSIPLLPSSMAVLSTNIQHKKPESEKDQKVFQNGSFGIHSDWHSFFSHSPGIYIVGCVVECPFLNDRRSSVAIQIPQASYGEICFSVPKQQNENQKCQITANPSLSHEVISESDKTVLKAIFPATSKLTIQWTDISNENENNEEKKSSAENSETKNAEQQIVTLEQDTLYSVGEGVLYMDATFNYTLVHTSRSYFTIVLQDKIRVLQVDGENIKRWKLLDSSEKNNQEQRNLSLEKSEKLLMVELKFAVVNNYSFSVSMELDLGDTSVRDMSLPVVWSRDVAREKSNFLVEALTNVEVEEKSTRGVTPIDINEVSEFLSSSSSNALFAYKTLFPKSANITVNITKHQDTVVLVTSIDKCKFDVTVAEDGQYLHKVTMSVRNTQRQYLRTKLPKKFMLWSTVVGGHAIKPAIDAEGQVMIPLEKSHGDSKQKQFVVELIYLIQGPPMKSNGKLNLEFAIIDIPINILLVTLYLPNTYSYRNFDGTVRKTQYFSSNQMIVSQAHEMKSRALESNLMSNCQAMQTNPMMYDSCNEELEMDDDDVYVASKTKVGVVPVLVEFPQVGRQFLFEKLLINSEPQNITVSYNRNNNGSCSVL
eukprot:c20369_g1_i3.p1 GENE.c20369_g1_i3~~c20369_g1_i3.p1  ORF type:complete len:665 (+),score=216.30 c20369_g1_i3:23-1996(+)